MKRFESILVGTSVEPRPYQRTIVAKTSDMFGGRYVNGAGHREVAARSIMVESPTGSGKTVMGHLAAKLLQAEHKDLTIGWVAIRRHLLAQAAAENEKHKINVRDIHYTSMFDDEPTELVKARKAGRKILLVVDEAQHDAAASMAHLHNLLEPNWILGLTATPFRTDKIKLCFDKVVKDAGIHQLIQDGYLSQFDHYSLPKWDPETVVNFYAADPVKWGKSIFYFLNLEQCELALRLLLERQDEIIAKLRAGRPDLSLSCGLAQLVVGGQHKVTDMQLELFRAGELACLVNCMVLTEGFDDPSLETAWVRDSVKGPTMQMAGRAFRIHPEFKAGNEAFKFKQIVQSKHTKWPILKTAMAAQQWLWQNNEWRSLTVNPHLREINNAARLAIASTETSMPKFLLDKQERGRRFRRSRGPTVL